jgi:hypothetical protein
LAGTFWLTHALTRSARRDYSTRVKQRGSEGVFGRGGREPRNKDGSDVRDVTDLVVRVHALCDRGNFAKAERIARAALTLRPGYPTARVALGRTLIGLRRLDEAQVVLIEAAHAHPGYAAAYRWLAEAFLKAGDPDRGRAFLAEALQRPLHDPTLDRFIDHETGEIVIPGALRDEDFEPTAPFDMAEHVLALTRPDPAAERASAPASPVPVGPPLGHGHTPPTLVEGVGTGARPLEAAPPTALAAPARRTTPVRSWRTLLATFGAAAVEAAVYVWRRVRLRERGPAQPRTPSAQRAPLRPRTATPQASTPRPLVRTPGATRTASAPPGDAASARARRVHKHDSTPRPGARRRG